jgi:dihydrofolate synthase / folylpolyglutamate synthase
MLNETDSLSEWLEYIETLNPKVMDLGLDRVAKVAEKLDLIHFSCPVISIGGTNGKGSCVAFLEAILSASGYRVGAYTSPHLLRFNERIKLANTEVDDASLCRAFSVIETARGDLSLTYFEFTTLAVLWIFKQSNLDTLLLEVGLGGRLDAVNIVESDIAILTTIAIDHTDWLGHDRNSIGYEKSGIFRPGKPAICGDFDPPPSIFQTAERLNTQLYCVNRDFSYQLEEGGWLWQSTLLSQQYSALAEPHLPMQNAATALMAVALLNRDLLPVSLESLRQGLISASIPGRFQSVLHRSVPTIFDVAHNPAAAELLAQRLAKQTCLGRTFAVVSILADKDIKGSLAPLLDTVDSWYVGSLAVPRGCTAEQISQHLQDIGAEKWYNYGSVNAAYYAALEQANQEDRVVVYGSFHTVATLLKIITI